MNAAIRAPSGTVTFLLTDIEASSRRWDSHRDAMAQALRRHDAIMREAIRAHGGYVFKTAGDSFCAAFQSAPAALGAAVDAQRALLHEDFAAVEGLRVRMALHSGDSEERDGDYFGPALNRAARLVDIAHGGQILLSGAANELALNDLPPGITLRDLGTHRLKDLAQPERVHQALAGDLPSEFPALLSLEAHPNNLPFALTTFIGREREVGEVKALLDAHRFITLAGAGGVGKTRLAIQVGAEVLHRFSDGAWFVDLAPLRNPRFVPAAVAKSLGLVETAGISVTELVVGYLERRNALLIFDNCEHVIGAVAVLVNEILSRCEHVRVLATSREPLSVTGEHALRVASLGVPEKGSAPTLEEALRFGAVALFVDRATSVCADFALTQQNVAQVVELCRRLDGIALAIELAAARVKVLSVEHLNEKLNDRFRLLTAGSRTALPRQQTMRALIDWSYDLLSGTEQTLFRRLAVFANGWNLAEAYAIGRVDLEDWQLVDGLASLVDKSLVIAEVSGVEERFKLYESTRQYALEKLEEHRERAAFERAHAQYFAELAEHVDETWENTPTGEWLAPLEPDEDNFRAALVWTLEQRNDPVLGARLVSRLPRLWWTAARQVEGIRWYESALKSGEDGMLAPEIVARLWYGLAVMHSTTLMRREARESAERAVGLARACGNPLLLGWSVLVLGVACALMGDPSEGRRRCTEGLAIAQRLDATRLLAWLGWAQAVNEYFSGEFDLARGELDRQLEAARRLGDELLEGLVLVFLGNVEIVTGNAQSALAYANDSLTLYVRNGDRIGTALAHSNIAPCYLMLGRVDDVRASAREAVSFARDTQNARLIAIAIEYLAAVASFTEPERGAHLTGYAQAWYRTSGTPHDLTEQQAESGTLERLRAALARDDLDRAIALGAALTQAAAVEEALLV